MDVQFDQFGFYTLDMAYLNELHSIDDQVFYNSADPNYAGKPYLGIAVIIGKYRYFIPLTSAKQRHVKWKLVDKAHFLIYDMISTQNIQANYIIQRISNDADHVLQIMAALDLKKMIPVPIFYYHKVDFKSMRRTNPKYAALLNKELRFLLKRQDDIRIHIKNIYEEQKLTGKVYPYYCDFAKLEKFYDRKISEHLK